ncbi:efflux transporter periplasmic adaptor subunit [Photobacterium jeanii]|uniref:Efflux transporter periplasmic adaptor subunit n=1 Tax=Photobacterium jeanii TaxID=858640 RepID=A0A178KPT3_9GAMM|nr:efflux RND transporter periplasmic adaptor subunit [Photobacterium jeanii]OAN18764.1 efflux transporter periplasmic adaptor subunit [Photobacterium jeanii]PST92826.1 efflux RND transporter periplasmic adaptor subunit [Photobacterium jeanii]
MTSIKLFFTRRPWVLSIIIIAVITLWLLSGIMSSPSDDVSLSSAPATDAKQEIPLAKVKVDTVHAQPITRTISLYGRTAPDRKATLGAEVSGSVEKLLIRKGQRVKQGQALVQLNKADRELQLQRAQALLKVRSKEYNAAKSLRERGLQNEVALVQAQAALVEAKASVKNLELALGNTRILAPFDGVVELLHVEQGDYLGVGDPVAVVVDLDPLVITADVSERHIRSISQGQAADVKLSTGDKLNAKLRYKASIASEQTNTFPIELEVPNPQFTYAAGISAEVDLILASQTAIKVTPSMLALDETGNLGIKTLGLDDKVVFAPIEVVKVDPDAVWLGGLGDKVDVITVGQGFVRDGDTVISVRNTGGE